VDEYFLDLRNFFRYLKQQRVSVPGGSGAGRGSTLWDVDLDFVAAVTLTDIYGYMA
jgi:hypothetical protein